MARRKRGKWMNKATDPVLELLDEIDMAVTAGAIEFELEQSLEDPPGHTTLYRALNQLDSRGYINRPRGEGTNLIEITDRGREYLRGQRDASDDS